MTTRPRFLDPPDQHFFLFGPRGTGKSTWLARSFPGALRVDLLSPEELRRFEARPERLRELVDGNPDHEVVVVDEVQRVPDLLPVVHQLIERGGPQRFVLTGSSSRKLKRAGVDLLAGRAVVRSMHPFMAVELGDDFDLVRALEHGLVPLVHSAADPADTLAAYVSLYMHEEVRLEGLVRDHGAFGRFLEAMTFSHGSVLNVSTVARDCEVPRSTAAGFLEILEGLLLSFRVPAFRRRAKRQLTAKDKFFLFDTGVFRALRPAGPLDRPEEIEGAALEGLVAQHLRAWCDYSPGRHQLYYWRTSSGSEVDFVVYGESGIHAFEIKRSRDVRREHLRSLRSFLEDYPEATATVLYLGEGDLQIGNVRCKSCAAWLRRLTPGTEPG